MFATVSPVTLDEEVAAATDDLCCAPLLGPSISDTDAAELAGLLKALADPVRIRLLNIIGSAGEACACDLPAQLDRSQPTVSHHLTILTKAGVLEREQRGKWAWFRINRSRLSGLCEALALPDPCC